MRRYFAPATRWIALAAIFWQGPVHAEDFASPTTSEEAQPQEVAKSASPVASAQKETPLFRHDTYPAAWTAAQKSNRPILVYVGMPNCPYCEKMIEKTYDLPEVGSLVASSFEPVYVGRFTHAKLVERLNVKWYPTTILVSPNNKVLDVIDGYVDAKTFRRRLQTGLAATATSTQTR